MKINRGNIVLIIIIAVLLVIIFVMIYKDFSNNSKNSDNIKESSIVTESATEKPTDIDSQSQNVLRNYTVAVELDKEYERRLSNAQSNFEKSEINSEFAEKWKAEMNKNYQNLLTVSWKFLKEKLIASQAEWYIYAEKRIDEEYEYLLQEYTTGTIVPVLLSKFECNLYRERAIELFEMYDELKSQAEIMEPSWQEHWESVRDQEHEGTVSGT